MLPILILTLDSPTILIDVMKHLTFGLLHAVLNIQLQTLMYKSFLFFFFIGSWEELLELI